MTGAIERVATAFGGVVLFYTALVVTPRLLPRAAAASPEAPQAAVVQQLNQLIAAEKWTDAAAPATQLVAAFPGNHIYAEHLANVWHHLNRPEAEAAAWERFVATSPNADEACPQMGEAYRLAGQLAKAIDAHERCLAFDPRNPDLLFHAAHAQEWKDDWTRARALYTEAAAIDPKNMDVQIGLGRVALHANDLTRARALIRPVLQRGENADALLLAGLIANRADDLNAARDYFTRGIAASPAYTDLHFYLGQLEERAGHIAAARTAYQRARVLDPARDDVQRALDRLGAAK